MTPAGERVGYVTSPWWSPELNTNIALGHVPIEFSEPGTALAIELPERYAETLGQPVAAEVSEVPFRPSVNPSAREAARAKGATTWSNGARVGDKASRLSVKKQM
jgi:aminomethyltransferase